MNAIIKIEGVVIKMSCGSCIHKGVCVYKLKYLKVVQDLDNAFHKTEDAGEFMELNPPKCKFFRNKEQTTIKSLERTCEESNKDIYDMANKAFAEVFYKKQEGKVE